MPKQLVGKTPDEKLVTIFYHQDTGTMEFRYGFRTKEIRQVDADLRVTVESEDTIKQRATVTRMAVGTVLLPIIGTLIAGMAAKKTTGGIYLVFDAPDWGEIMRLPAKQEKKVRQLAQLINQRVEELQRDAKAAATAAAPAEAADEIRKLAGLRDDGILTEEEFQAKKRQLLGL